MAFVGHISGSVQTNSVIGVTGSLVIASKPPAQFPALDSGIKFLVDEASLFKSTLVSSGSLSVKNPSGLSVFSVVAASGNTTVGGTLGSVGVATFSAGLSGSLTRLANGTSYLVAGSNVTIVSASNGQVTISSTGGSGSPGGLDTQVQFNDGGSFNGAEGVTYTKATYTLGVDNLSVTGSQGLSVLQAATVAGLANLNGGIAVDSTNFTVNGTSGAVSTASTLSVLQSITGSSTLTLAGQAILNGGIVCDSGAFQVSDTTGNVLTAGTLTAQGATLLNGHVTLGDASVDTIYFSGSVGTSVLPKEDITYDLGSQNLRWANVYTGDLHLRNDRGDYTLIEEEDMLTIRFNKTGKRYKFLLEAVPYLDEEPQLKF